MKRNRILLYAIGFLQCMVFYGSIATLYREACGISIFQISVIESISLILSLSLELPWGAAAEKIGYRKTMIICSFIYVLSKIVFWQASDFTGFLLERILLAIAISGLSGVDTALLYVSSEPEHSQHSFSIYESLSTAGLLTAGAVYSWFIGNNYRLAALMTVFSYAAAFLLSLGLKDIKPKTNEPQPSVKEMIQSLKSALHNRQLIYLILASTFLLETVQMLTVFINQMKYVSIGMSNAQIGTAYIIVIAVGMLGILSNRLTERFGRLRFGIIPFLTVAASCIVLIISSDIILCIMCFAIIRLSSNLFMPLSNTLQNEMISNGQRAVMLSMNALTMEALAVGIEPIFGKLAETDLNLAFIFGAVLSLFGMILYCMLNRHHVPETE